VCRDHIETVRGAAEISHPIEPSGQQAATPRTTSRETTSCKISSQSSDSIKPMMSTWLGTYKNNLNLLGLIK
jgi:BRCT domain type II-containing protein